ncbi:MAG: DNA/RNA nuclease SfsA, partial [Alphaproteobacteria bacterium]|nr:DNA/RNA nuclease SfsA [Alphaproteobacteria bacterium]
ELIQMVKEGHRAVMLFLSQRSDCNTFSVAESIDPLYAKTLRNAIREGVEVLAYRCTLTVDAIKIKDQMRIHL